MSILLQIVRYQVSDVIRTKWMLVYLIFLLAVTTLLYTLGESGERVLVSLVNVVLLLAPLVCLIFGTLYLYGARDFIELLLTQPVRRATLYAGLFVGLAAPLCAAYVVGVGAPYLLFGGAISSSFVMILIVGLMLTLCFTAVALLVAVRLEEKVQGMAVAVGLWLLATIVYDGVLLALLGTFSSYPLEKPAIIATLLNPVDLGRVLLLLQLDVAALMGYTGAVFERFFGSALGVVLAASALVLWTGIPFGVGIRVFARKDF